MKPGATTSPRASNFSSALPRILLGRALSATRPSRSKISIGALIFAAGSIRCPPLIRSEPGLDLSVVIQSIFVERQLVLHILYRPLGLLLPDAAAFRLSPRIVNCECTPNSVKIRAYR